MFTFRGRTGEMGFGITKPADEPGKAWPAILIGLFVAFGGVLYGYDVRRHRDLMMKNLP